MALPQVELPEAILVVEGLGPFLRHSKRDMTGAIAKAERLEETIAAKLYRFINSAERVEPADLPAFDLEEVTTLLETKAHPDDVQKTIAAFGDQGELALPVGQQVARISAYLLSKLPRRTHIGLAGPVPIEPSPSELYRFRRLWAIAMDPMSIFADLLEYALSRDQAQAFADMFPATFATLWPQVQEAMTRKVGASKGWQPGRRQELLLRILCKQEAPSLVLAKALVPIYAQEQAEDAAQQQTVRPKQTVSSSNESTEAQRSLLA